MAPRILRRPELRGDKGLKQTAFLRDSPDFQLKTKVEKAKEARTKAASKGMVTKSKAGRI
jgi:hypothetical protein